jgi:nitrite reductase (NADH) small subunit
MEVTVASVSSIPPGEGRTFEVGTLRIAVFHTRQGEVFAAQAECPHRGGPLADGILGGSTLVCPLHSWKFDLETGRTHDGQCALVTYPARLSSSGQVIVELGAVPGQEGRGGCRTRDGTAA